MRVKIFGASSRALLLWIWLIASSFATSQAQICPTPSESGGSITAPQATVYTFYLDGVDNLLKIGWRDSFNMWDARNLTHNCSGVGFSENTGPHPAIQGDYDILCYNANPIPDTLPSAVGLASCVYSNPNACNGKFWRVKCKMWLRFPSNSGLSNQGNYFTSFPIAVRKLSAHEIGHVMGLSDQPAPYVQHASIMNYGYGTNDAGVTDPFLSANGNLPWDPPEPTACDHAGIQCYTCPPPPPPPPPQCYTQTNYVYDWVGNCLVRITYRYYICDGFIVSVDSFISEYVWCGPQE